MIKVSPENTGIQSAFAQIESKALKVAFVLFVGALGTMPRSRFPFTIDADNNEFLFVWEDELNDRRMICWFTHGVGNRKVDTEDERMLFKDKVVYSLHVLDERRYYLAQEGFKERYETSTPKGGQNWGVLDDLDFQTGCSELAKEINLIQQCWVS